MFSFCSCKELRDVVSSQGGMKSRTKRAKMLLLESDPSRIFHLRQKKSRPEIEEGGEVRFGGAAHLENYSRSIKSSSRGGQ